MADENNAPLGANGSGLGFEPPQHLKELARDNSRPFGWGEGRYEEDERRALWAKPEAADNDAPAPVISIEDDPYWDSRLRETALESAIQAYGGSSAMPQTPAGIVAAAKDFLAFLKGED